MPYMYEALNLATAARQPGQVQSQDTILVSYFRRYLLGRAISVFRWRLPPGWDPDFVRYALYCIGFVAVVETDKFGVVPQVGTLSGRGLYYQPTEVLITNPLFDQSITAQIGRNCELIKLQPDYGGIMDLVNDYAEAMALTSETFSINTLNSRLSYVFGAENKNAAETFKKGMQELYDGSPMTVWDKKLWGQNGEPAWQLLLQNVGQNYIAGELLENLRRLECKFNNEIGIPANLATAKKERTISAEVEANDAETYTRADCWLETIRDGCKRVKRMFGVDISVDWRVDPLNDQRGGGDDERNTELSGADNGRS